MAISQDWYRCREMRRFSVPIHGLGDPRHPNTACFVDFVQALVAALRELGHEVVPPTVDGHNVDRTARPIAFGEQNMQSVDWEGDPGSFMPADAILFNTEQTGARGCDPKRIFDAVKTWQKRVVWDYSETNAKVLRAMGCERVVHCPVGYSPAMTRITPLKPEEEDIDVLFAGSVETPKRIVGLAAAGIKVLDRGQILADLKNAGLNTVHVWGVYGADLDPYIARAKVVLNLHYYEGAVFEIFRCSHLLANKKCIVTEDGGCDEELESFAYSSMVYTPRGKIVEICKKLVGAYHLRRMAGDLGFDVFSRTSLTNNVRKALEQS